jgi:hypothetical protein
MHVAILPSGALLADTAPDGDDTSDGLSVAARARVVRAFGRGPGHALLDLGATELDAPLSPPLAFLRDIGRAFVTRLRAVSDLEERRERVEVDCPPDERARLAGTVPPMDIARWRARSRNPPRGATGKRCSICSSRCNAPRSRPCGWPS